jgi:hypothetical protein
MEPQEEPAAMDAMEPDGAAPGAVAPPPTAAAPAAAPPASVAAPPPANVRPQLPRGRAGKAREAAAASGVRQ